MTTWQKLASTLFKCFVFYRLMSTALSVYTELSRNSVDQEIALNNCSLSINYDVLHGLFINVVSSFNYKRKCRKTDQTNLKIVKVLLPACFAAPISLKKTPALLIHLWVGLFTAAMTTSKHWTPHCQLRSHHHMVHRWGWDVGDTHCYCWVALIFWSNFKNAWRTESRSQDTGK